MISSAKPVFVLSGMSGTGKSCILEDARSMGCRVLRSFTKQLLDTRMGDGVPLYDYLLADCFMQAVHLQDFCRNDIKYEPWVVERSIIDHYFFGVVLSKHQQTASDIEDMDRKIRDYFRLITDDFTRELVIVSIWNWDHDWIESSLENEFRKELVSNVNDYLRLQVDYKNFYFSKLIQFGIKYRELRKEITNVKSDFTPEMRREWIKLEMI